MNTFIVFLGIDGSGKSTLIEEIMKHNNKSWYFHFCPTDRYNKKIKSCITEDNNKKKNYSAFISNIKLIFLFFQFYLGKKVIKKKEDLLIIGDRYFYDIIVDPDRYRLKINKKIILFFMKSFIIKPDIIFYCTAEPSIMLSRKNEKTLYEINELEKRFKNLFKNLKDIEVIKIDTTKINIEENVKYILNKIKNEKPIYL